MSSLKFIKVRTYTWPRDCHNLFDYESRHVLASEMKIHNPSQIVLNNNLTQILEKDQINPEEGEAAILRLLNINKDLNGCFTLSTPSENGSHPGMDVIVRGLKEDNSQIGYELKVGDYVKLGRVRFLVKEIRDHAGRVRRAEMPPASYKVMEGNQPAEENNPMACRICLMDQVDEDPINNTILAPCKCKGSCGYVHYQCLRQWTDSKNITTESSNPGGLKNLYKKLFCEICKHDLPFTMEIRGEQVDMLSGDKPCNGPYIILERIEGSLEKRALFIVSDISEETWIGRSYSNKIVVNDISVSRIHASIKYENGKFLIFDNKSKFGTLVQVKEPIEVTNEKMVIQCGKTVVAFSLKTEKVKPIEIENEGESENSIPTSGGVSPSDTLDETSLDEAKKAQESKLVSLSKKISKKSKSKSNSNSR